MLSYITIIINIGLIKLIKAALFLNWNNISKNKLLII